MFFVSFNQVFYSCKLSFLCRLTYTRTPSAQGVFRFQQLLQSDIDRHESRRLVDLSTTSNEASDQRSQSATKLIERTRAVRVPQEILFSLFFDFDVQQTECVKAGGEVHSDLVVERRRPPFLLKERYRLPSRKTSALTMCVKHVTLLVLTTV